MTLSNCEHTDLSIIDELDLRENICRQHHTKCLRRTERVAYISFQRRLKNLTANNLAAPNVADLHGQGSSPSESQVFSVLNEICHLVRFSTALRRHLSSETRNLRATIFSWGPGSRSACILGKQTHMWNWMPISHAPNEHCRGHNSISATSCQINIERCNLNRVSLKFFSRISPILKEKRLRKPGGTKLGH